MPIRVDDSVAAIASRQRAREVLARAQRNVAAERAREAKIASGASVSELLKAR